MSYKQEDDFTKLKNRILGISFNVPVGGNLLSMT